MFLLAGEIGLTQSERIELAQYLLRRDIRSWSELDEAQVCRILDALEGYQLIDQLIVMRASDTVEGLGAVEQTGSSSAS